MDGVHVSLVRYEEARHAVDSYSELFAQLAMECGLPRFLRFDLAAGKLPLPVSALREEHGAAAAPQYASDNVPGGAAWCVCGLPSCRLYVLREDLL